MFPGGAILGEDSVAEEGTEDVLTVAEAEC
jgi:hypothetical protein